MPSPYEEHDVKYVKIKFFDWKKWKTINFFKSVITNRVCRNCWVAFDKDKDQRRLSEERAMLNMVRMHLNAEAFYLEIKDRSIAGS